MKYGPIVRHEQVNIAEGSVWRNLPTIFGAVGVVGLALGFFSMSQNGSKPFYFAYLTALMFWLAIALGGLFFTLIQHATRAGWSITCRRIAENFAITLPVLGLLALPVVFLGTHDLFHWSHEGVMDHDPMLAAKAPYLNEFWFRIRGVLYIATWSGLAYFFYTWSTNQDTAADPLPYTHKMRWWAAPGLALFGLSTTFAAFDWLMSLDPHWFSTIFGVYYFAGCVITIHAAIALTVILLHNSGYLNGVVTKEHFHDLGKMMFAFTVFWAYVGFSQYFLQWYASIPEETHWYYIRGQGQFMTLSLVLVFGRFVFPFLGMISRHIKRNPRTLAFAATWVIAIEYFDMYWLIMPVMGYEKNPPDYSLHFGLPELSTFLGIGGLMLATFTWALTRRALVPMKDPRLEESVNFENF